MTDQPRPPLLSHLQFNVHEKDKGMLLYDFVLFYLQVQPILYLTQNKTTQRNCGTSSQWSSQQQCHRTHWLHPYRYNTLVDFTTPQKDIYLWLLCSTTSFCHCDVVESDDGWGTNFCCWICRSLFLIFVPFHFILDCQDVMRRKWQPIETRMIRRWELLCFTCSFWLF